MPYIDITTGTVKLCCIGANGERSYISRTLTFRVNYSENYNSSNNTTTVTIDSNMQVKQSGSGSIPVSQFNGTGVSFSKDNSNWSNVIPFGHSNQTSALTSDFAKILYTSTGNSITVPHNSSGSAILYAKISFNIFMATAGYYGTESTYTASKNGSLTTHVCTLSINPDSGIWSGSSSIQNFTSAPTSTKSVPNPTRTGYNFDGWLQSGGGTFDSSTNIYTFGDSNGSLTAQWDIITSSLTTLIDPDNYGTVSADPSGALDYGQQAQLTANPTSPSGYTTQFVSWEIESGTGAGAVLSSTSTNPTTFTMGTAPATVIAHFSRSANHYYVQFVGNGATSGNMPDQEFIYDASENLNTCSYYKNNYEFDHWNTAQDDSGTRYEDGQLVINLATGGTIVLYAFWKAVGYDITYYTAHGTAPQAQKKIYNVPLTLQNFIAAPSDRGATASYTITGDANGGTWTGDNGSATKTPVDFYRQTEWNTDATGAGTSYTALQSYYDNADLGLYAIFDTTHTYDYTYILPTDTPTKLESRIVTYNPTGGTASQQSAISSRDCQFTGWYTIDGVQRTPNSQVSASETVYAHYTDPSFSFITTLTSAECSWEDHKLVGWATSSDATVPQYSPGASFIPASSLTLYAIWGDYGRVYINNEEYQILIYNNGNWETYRAYIGDGTQWTAY